MPKRRLTYKKKRGGKRRRVARRKRRVPRHLPLNGFASTLMVRHRYCDHVTLDCGLGTIATHVFRANSIYDSDVTGTGHQSRGVDSFLGTSSTSGPYNHFTVVGSKIRMIPCTPTATQTGLVPNYGITLRSDSTLPQTDWVDLAESRLAGPGVFGRKDFQHSRPARSRFSTRKFFGCGKGSVVGNALYRGTGSADPQEGAYFICWACHPTMADTNGIEFAIIIDYLVVYSEPKYLPES